MDNKMTIQQWEKEQGIMFLGDGDDDIKPKRKIDGLQFRELMAQNNFVTVDHAAREQFLKDNDHEVTRENMLNNDLEPLTDEERKARDEKAAKKPASSQQNG